MKLVEHDLCFPIRNLLADRLPIRLPHVHRDGLDARALGLAQPLEIGYQALCPAVISDVQHAPLIEIDHDAHILMPLEEALLIDPEPGHRLPCSAGESAAHGPLLDPARLLPRQAQPPCHGRRRRLPQPRDGQPFEQQRKARALLGPRHARSSRHPSRTARGALVRPAAS
jgi:hypothetical protein